MRRYSEAVKADVRRRMRPPMRQSVAQVLLISTDKAVRPTNVMGASKRLAELVVQAHAAEASSTRFSMVRYRCAGLRLWQCARVFRLGGAPVSPPDRCRWSDHPHPPGDHSLLHDHPRGGNLLAPPLADTCLGVTRRWFQPSAATCLPCGLPLLFR